jgi:hypothetical protein
VLGPTSLSGLGHPSLGGVTGMIVARAEAIHCQMLVETGHDTDSILFGRLSYCVA